MASVSLTRTLTIVLLTISTPGTNKSQNSTEFESFFGGPWSNGASSIAPLSDGGFILGGWKSREGQPEKIEGWIIRVDDRGWYLWDLPVPDTGSGRVLALSSALDGGLSAIADTDDGPSSNTKLIKVSRLGQVEWIKNYGGRGQDRVSKIRPTFDGGLIMAGSTTTGSHGLSDGWVAILDRIFDLQWFRTLGGVGENSFSDIVVTPENTYVAVDTIMGPTDRNLGWAVMINSLGGTSWESTHDLSSSTSFQSLRAIENGDFIFTANLIEAPQQEKPKAATGSFDFSGALLWQRGIVASGSMTAFELGQRSDGILLAGTTIEDDIGEGTLIVEFTAVGEVKAVIRHSRTRMNQGRAISVMGSNAYASGGVSTERLKMNQDVWLVIGREIYQSSVTLPVSEP